MADETPAAPATDAAPQGGGSFYAPAADPSHPPVLNPTAPRSTVLMEVGQGLVSVGTVLADPLAPETARQWVKRHRVWLAIIAVLTVLIFVV